MYLACEEKMYINHPWKLKDQIKGTDQRQFNAHVFVAHACVIVIENQPQNSCLLVKETK